MRFLAQADQSGPRYVDASWLDAPWYIHGVSPCQVPTGTYITFDGSVAPSLARAPVSIEASMGMAPPGAPSQGGGPLAQSGGEGRLGPSPCESGGYNSESAHRQAASHGKEKVGHQSPPHSPSSAPLQWLTAGLQQSAAGPPGKWGKLQTEEESVSAATNGGPRRRAWDAGTPKSSRRARTGNTNVDTTYDAALRGYSERTLLLKHLPAVYTRDMLIDKLDDEGLLGLYNFVYVPMRFHDNTNFRYGFVNVVSEEAAQLCQQKFEGYNKWGIECDDVCSVCMRTDHHGLAAHIQLYRNSPVMHPDVKDSNKPQLFRGGVRVPFPPPTRAVKPPRERVPNKSPDGAARALLGELVTSMPTSE